MLLLTLLATRVVTSPVSSSSHFFFVRRENILLRRVRVTLGPRLVQHFRSSATLPTGYGAPSQGNDSSKIAAAIRISQTLRP